MEQTSSIVPSSTSKGKEIVTHSEETSLNDLKETAHGQVIYVKVYRKWTPTNKQGKPVLFCVLLIDKQVQNTIPIFNLTVTLSYIFNQNEKTKDYLPYNLCFIYRGWLYRQISAYETNLSSMPSFRSIKLAGYLDLDFSRQNYGCKLCPTHFHWPSEHAQIFRTRLIQVSHPTISTLPPTDSCIQK